MPYQRRPTRHGRTWHDQKAPDGYTVNGWRRIFKGGYVRMGRIRHYHADFEKWVGMYVFVEIADPYTINVDVWPDEPWKDHRTRLFCTNEGDWFADDPAAAVRASRRR